MSIPRTARREPGESVHDFQHRLIADRKAAYYALPKGNTGIARYRRREADKRATWTLQGHLRGMHHVRGQAPFLRMSYADMERLHEERHAEEAQP